METYHKPLYWYETVTYHKPLYWYETVTYHKPLYWHETVTYHKITLLASNGDLPQTTLPILASNGDLPCGERGLIVAAVVQKLIKAEGLELVAGPTVELGLELHPEPSKTTTAN